MNLHYLFITGVCGCMPVTSLILYNAKQILSYRRNRSKIYSNNWRKRCIFFYLQYIHVFQGIKCFRKPLRICVKVNNDTTTKNE